MDSPTEKVARDASPRRTKRRRMVLDMCRLVRRQLKKQSRPSAFHLVTTRLVQCTSAIVTWSSWKVRGFAARDFSLRCAGSRSLSQSLQANITFSSKRGGRYAGLGTLYTMVRNYLRGSSAFSGKTADSVPDAWKSWSTP